MLLQQTTALFCVRIFSGQPRERSCARLQQHAWSSTNPSSTPGKNGGATWHEYAGKIPVEGTDARIEPSRRALAAVQSLDKTEGLQLIELGVSVRFLKRLTEQHLQLTSADIVSVVVKPATASTQCRFVELPEMKAESGKAVVFVSHTWRAPFADLVAACAYALPDEAFVWCDLFAVRQWPGNSADLDFAPVVSASRAMLLVASHLDEVARLNRDAIIRNEVEVPQVALQKCAFFRIWCIVEVVAAIVAGKPTVMLIGKSAGGTFVPNAQMCINLFHMVTVEQATASVDADRQRILADVAAQMGFQTLNIVARGAIKGAMDSMSEKEVLGAACGFVQPLMQMPTERLGQALVAAAAGGFATPVELLLSRNAPVNAVGGQFGGSPLMQAAQGGHLSVVQALIAAKADVNVRNRNGGTPLVPAMISGNPEVVRVLLAAGAKIDAANKFGDQPLHHGARRGHAEAVAVLVEAKADVNAEGAGRQLPIEQAVDGGHTKVIEILMKAGSAPDRRG